LMFFSMFLIGRKRVMQVEQDIPASALVRVSILGPLEISKRDPSGTWKLVPKEQWKNSKPARSVFKRLLVQPGRRLSRTTIEDDLWSETDNFEYADRNVYDAISLIRRVIGKPLVTLWGQAYEVADQTLVWTDLDACDILLKEAENLGHVTREALPLLERALILLERGELLEGEDGKWCYAFRKRAEDMLKQCRMWLAESYETQGKCWQAGEQYRALCQTIPPDEEALERWMAMLWQQGKRQDALKRYRETKAFAEAQEWTLSPALDVLVAHLEEQQDSAPGIVDSFVFAEAAVSPWQPDPASPETAIRLTAWGGLLQANSEGEARQGRVCDVLEVAILTMTWRWKRSSGPIALLQQLIYEVIRKHDAMRKNVSDHDSKLTRRQALQAVALFPLEMYGLSLFAPETPQRLPLEEMLPCCASGIVACWELRQYEPEGLAEIERLLPAYLATLEKLARQSSPYQQDAARLAAQGYLLMGVLAEHFRRLDQMEAAARMARLYGQLAHDPNLEVAALIRLATKRGLERHMVEAFSTYQEAVAFPEFATVTPLLQGRVYAGLAGTGAFCHRPQALSFLSQAKDLWPTEPESDPSFCLRSAGRESLSIHEGLTLKRTGHHAEAIEVFSRFGSLTPVPGLLDYYRAQNLNYTASVAVEQRELDTAYLYLDTAEEVSRNIQNKQRQAEVRDTFREMQLLWPTEPKVKMLQEKLYA
jgi:DNA-binding SARP family transcriptional activator